MAAERMTLPTSNGSLELSEAAFGSRCATGCRTMGGGMLLVRARRSDGTINGHMTFCGNCVATAIAVEFVTCCACGVAVLIDPFDDEDAMELHRRWHHGPGGAASLRERLTLAREAAGLSYSELAERSGVSRALLLRMGGNEVPNLTLATISRVATALGVQPSWLAFGPPSPVQESRA